MMSAIKSGAVSHSRFAKMAEMDYKVSNNISKSLQRQLLHNSVLPAKAILFT